VVSELTRQFLVLAAKGLDFGVERADFFAHLLVDFVPSALQSLSLIGRPGLLDDAIRRVRRLARAGRFLTPRASADGAVCADQEQGGEDSR
jgi:hypothetical protein